MIGDETSWLTLALRAVVALEAYVEAYRRDVALAERNEARLVRDLVGDDREDTDAELDS